MDSVGFRRRRFRRGLCRFSLPSPDPARRSDAERRRRSTIPPERPPSLARRACKRTKRRATRLSPIPSAFVPPSVVPSRNGTPDAAPAEDPDNPEPRPGPLAVDSLLPMDARNRQPRESRFLPALSFGRSRAPRLGADSEGATFRGHDSAVPPKIGLALHAIQSPSARVATQSRRRRAPSARS